MAKDTGVSQRTIDAVAAALRLTPAEQKHLRLLATGALPEALPAQDVDPTLRAVLDGYNFGPAMLLNVRMDVVAANALAVAIFGDLAAASGYEGNWLWYLFAHHAMIDEWEAQARELTATFHGSMCEHAKDPEYQALLHRLLESSETFRRFWNEHDVSQLDQVPPLALAHPTFGPLRFTMRVLAQPGATNPFYVCFLVPDDATAQSDMFRRLMTEKFRNDGLNPTHAILHRSGFHVANQRNVCNRENAGRNICSAFHHKTHNGIVSPLFRCRLIVAVKAWVVSAARRFYMLAEYCVTKEASVMK